MKRLAILGVTGSIGRQTLEVVREHADRLQIDAVSAGHNLVLLRQIIQEFQPKSICVAEAADAYRLQRDFPQLKIVSGADGLISVATDPQVETVVNALMGFVGLRPTLAAIAAGKDIALANKETLVVGGKFVTEAAKRHGVHILPIDSEHSAIFQALQGNKASEVRRLLITASGGSLRDRDRSQLRAVTKADALHHPNWAMGEKITIDSATMMNKGLEVIEAHWLFDKELDDIEVVMHPESIVHSLIEYQDGAVMAQLGSADMRIPIQYALCYPERLASVQNKRLDLAAVGTLHFAKPDLQRYPLLELAYRIGRLQGNMPAIMNAANEEAVRLFLQEKITFLQIEELVLKACSVIPYVANIDLSDINHYDKMARDFVLKEGVCQ